MLLFQLLGIRKFQKVFRNEYAKVHARQRELFRAYKTKGNFRSHEKKISNQRTV